MKESLALMEGGDLLPTLKPWPNPTIESSAMKTVRKQNCLINRGMILTNNAESRNGD